MFLPISFLSLCSSVSPSFPLLRLNLPSLSFTFLFLPFHRLYPNLTFLPSSTFPASSPSSHLSLFFFFSSSSPLFFPDLSLEEGRRLLRGRNGEVDTTSEISFAAEVETMTKDEVGPAALCVFECDTTVNLGRFGHIGLVKNLSPGSIVIFARRSDSHPLP